MEENNIYDAYVYENEIKHPKREKKPSKIGFVLLCAILGFTSGLGGSIVGNKFLNKNGGSNNDIIYQSVVLSDEDGNDVDALSVKDIVINVKDSVVEITTSVTKTSLFMGQYVTSGAGSGVILSKEGLIVTNHHVINEADEISVRLSNGETHDAKLIASDVQTDLAVIRIDAENLQPAVLGNSDDMYVGDAVYAIGNPLGSLGGTVTEGILSAKDREITIEGQSMTLLQTSAAINPGNSGGGLFNAKGELIGVVNAKSSGSDIEGLGFAIPIDIAKTVVNDLVETGKVSGRLTLGVSYYEINSLTDAMKYGVNALGLLVGEVMPNSNASRAGIKVNDVIVEVDGKQVATTDDLRSSLTKHKAGDTMKFVVLRDRDYVELSVVLK